MQDRNRLRSINDCPFCKGPEDSLEHFVLCPKVVKLFNDHGFRCSSMLHFLALDHGCSDDHLRQKAKLLHTVFHARNTIVHSTIELETVDAFRAAYNQLP